MTAMRGFQRDVTKHSQQACSCDHFERLNTVKRRNEASNGRSCNGQLLGTSRMVEMSIESREILARVYEQGASTVSTILGHLKTVVWANDLREDLSRLDALPTGCHRLSRYQSLSRIRHMLITHVRTPVDPDQSPSPTDQDTVPVWFDSAYHTGTDADRAGSAVCLNVGEHGERGSSHFVAMANGTSRFEKSSRRQLALDLADHLGSFMPHTSSRYSNFVDIFTTSRATTFLRLVRPGTTYQAHPKQWLYPTMACFQTTARRTSCPKSAVVGFLCPRPSNYHEIV